MAAEYKYQEITRKVIGACLAVHQFLGNGFPERIYQRALALEMSNVPLSFQEQVERQVFYKAHHHPIGVRRADFLVEDKVLIELKAISELDDACVSQTLNYLKVFRLEVAILVNFGSKSLEFQRLVN